MRILHLTTSDATHGTAVSEAERSHSIVERMLAEASGEPVESILKPIWLAPELPDIIDRWMERYKPEMVLFHVNPFWYLHASVPLKLERKFGRAGKKAGELGVSASKSSWLSERWFYHVGRRLALRTIGGAYIFTPEQVIDVTTTCVRRILGRDEDVALVLRGTLLGRRDSPIARERAVHIAIANLAEELHFTWLSRDPSAPILGEAYLRTGDRFHGGADLHRYWGEVEGAAMVAAWERTRDGVIATK